MSEEICVYYRNVRKKVTYYISWKEIDSITFEDHDFSNSV